MLRTFHAARRLRGAVETTRNRIDRHLRAWQLASIEASVLHRSALDETFTGSKPLLILENGRSERYLLKVGAPELLAAEVAAHELRALGHRPSVPAKIVTIPLEDLGTVTGALKPYIEFDTSLELPPDTRQWTPLQRAAILMDHAWEWFLDNLDTNTSQYALFGAEGYPVNLDWDRSFCTEGRSSLSRFAKYKRSIPNARTFLYADYVEGRVDLPFALLLAEARHIRTLPVSSVRPVFEQYARVRYEDPQAREEFVARMLTRKRRIELEFREFVRALISERRSLLPHKPGVRSRLRAFAVTLWNHWQLVLHRFSRGPVGALGRRALRFIRGRRHLPRRPTTGRETFLGASDALRTG